VTSDCPTVGAQSVDLSVRRKDGEVVSIKIWDTAGQEQYRTLVPMYFRGARVAALLFDLTEQSSFNSLDGWVTQLRESSPTCELAIVGNKADLDGRIISWDEGEARALRLGASWYIETSAVTGQNVMELFQRFADSSAFTQTLSNSTNTVNEQPVAEPSNPEPSPRKGCPCQL
jgi:Ras-related protein Rab-6A